jgi:hypothetical protein
MYECPFDSPTERSSRCSLHLYGVKLRCGINEFVARHRDILVGPDLTTAM